jgi:hypothetical protein
MNTNLTNTYRFSNKNEKNRIRSAIKEGLNRKSIRKEIKPENTTEIMSVMSP